MELIDEIREDRKRLKGKSWKEKASHIFTYYKFPILAALVVVCIAVSLICSRIGSPETALSGILLNGCRYDSMLSDEDPSSFSEEFLDELHLDRSHYTLSFRMNLTYSQSSDSVSNSYSDYQSLMTIVSYAAAEELDFITGDLGAMVGLAYQGYFADLSEVLTEEQYAVYAPCFLYIDWEVLEAINDQAAESQESVPEIPDCRKPETMERPVPVLIDMSRSDTLQSVYCYSFDTIAFGMIANAPHPDNTLKYIDYLMR